MPATTVSKLIYEVIWDDSDASKKADAWDRKLQESAKQAGKSFSGLTDALIGGFGKAVNLLSDGIVAIGKDAIHLEDALSGVKRTANLSEEQITILTSKVRDLSSEQLRGAVSAQELGEILEVAGQRGKLAGENFEETLQGALDFTQQIATASKALDLSFGATADRLGKLQTAFGPTSVEAGYLANAINVLADSTAAAAPSMINLAQKAAPALAQFKVSQGDLLGFAGALDSLGVSSYTASTALQRAFKEMTGNTDAFAEAFGINADELNRLVREDIGAAFTLLLDHIRKMATETPDGTQKVAQALKDLGVSGAGVSTALLGLAGMGEELKTKFLDPANEGLTNMDSINKEFINSISKVSQLWDSLGVIFMNTVGVIGDAMLPLLRDLLLQINDQAIAFREWFVNSEFITDMLPGAIESIRQGVSQLLPQIVELVKNMDWDQLFKDAKNAWDGLMVVGEAFFEVITKHLPNAIKGFESLLKAIDPIITIIKTSMDAMMLPIEALNKAFLKIIDTVLELGGGFDKVFAGMLGWIDKGISALGAMAGKLSEVISKLWETEEASHGSSVWPEMVSWIDKAQLSTDAMKNRLGEVTTALEKTGQTLGAMSPDQLQGLVNAGILSRSPASSPADRPSYAQPAFDQFATSISNLVQPKQNLQVNLVMDNQQVATMNAVLDDNKQQQSRRSFAGSGGGFGGSRRGF